MVGAEAFFMDIKIILRRVSRKLLEDFEISANINHSGSKGMFRETSLREFLKEGRLPQRYGIGTGEIVGRARNVSHQSDLIIWDNFNGIALLLNNATQVFPIEAVYGVIEVKSTLSKQELVKALENIKSVKALTPKENIIQSNPVMQIGYPRPTPFGMVFAYGLSNNSLDSLRANLKEWEDNNSPEHWPNMIAVLGHGIIHHWGSGMKHRIANKDIQLGCSPIALEYKEDTLFQFYITLLDLCTGTHLGPPELRRYYDPAEQIGSYIVRNHDRFQKVGSTTDRCVYRLNLQFIEKVVSWCKNHGKISQKDLTLKQIGQVVAGMDESSSRYEVYHYDPDNLPGLHEVSNAISVTSAGAHINRRLLVPAQWVEIDNEVFYFSSAYVTDGDLEKIEGRSVDDL